jgi:CHAD domain-containing protein
MNAPVLATRRDPAEPRHDWTLQEVEALFALARELARAAPLHLSFDTKSARGQALAAGAAGRRRKPPPLRADASAAEAFQVVARHALAQIAAGAVLLRDQPGSEAVHRLRVAARRLRSLVALFRPLVADAAYAPLKAELRWFAKAFDRARGLDVFAAEVLQPALRAGPSAAGLAALAGRVAEHGELARREAAAAAASERFRMLMIELTAWVETGDWLARPEAREPARAFAARRLQTRRRRLLRRGRGLGRQDAAARHELRIETKTLRYAVEALAGLYGKPKAAARLAKRLKRLQEALGTLNDIAGAADLARDLDLGPEAAFAAGRLAGLRAAGTPRLIAKAAKALARVERTRPFWR